jgi:hypothetical protein
MKPVKPQKYLHQVLSFLLKRSYVTHSEYEAGVQSSSTESAEHKVLYDQIIITSTLKVFCHYLFIAKSL